MIDCMHVFLVRAYYHGRLRKQQQKWEKKTTLTETQTVTTYPKKPCFLLSEFLFICSVVVFWCFIYIYSTA